ncbi:hypothetical protein SAMN05421739_106237 [Pontibacter chinhatensis]|uniref:Uncharacterized protein n=1 Tax=Pontibacter chinhatensis TaxID=1436961 RepID=A0A1I2XW06_9BACT|nr:hypothetical protein SAMN05421739_106237 [Pontibacter chinhatensis]
MRVVQHSPALQIDSSVPASTRSITLKQSLESISFNYMTGAGITNEIFLRNPMQLV